MSAITGIIQFDQKPISSEHSHLIMGELQRYPSDDVRIWCKDNIFFGCHHQWITPESINELLPFYDYAKQLVITSDAIIDNRDELFEMLQVKREFRKDIPDSQLILLAYEKWEEESPKYLIGDFAFMIWDERNQKLFGARDFSGCRTLYYLNKDNRFAFCTTMQPLLTLPLQRQLNDEWLSEFLAIPWNFETINHSSTVYKDIYQLPPSHSISVKEGKVKLTRYCQFNFHKKIKLKSNEEYEEALRDVYGKAVKSRLRTFKNVGAHLSGGLDSGSAVSLAATALREQEKKLYTFSYVPVDGFKPWTPKSRVADERPFIESTVRHVGNIEDHYLSFKGKSPYSEVDDWIDTLEMPYKFFENSFWLSGIYEKAFEKNVGVLLNGQRGNWTISWGPALDYQVMLFKTLRWIRLYQETHLFSKQLDVPWSKLVALVGKKGFSSMFQRSPENHPDNSVFPMMINPDLAERLKVYQKLQEQDIDLTGKSVTDAYKVRRHQFDRLYYWNINGTYSTKLSLRYKVWDRDPTNDLRVVKYCLSVPEDQYVQNGFDRSLIRRATQGILPDNIRLNQETRGIQGTDGIFRMLPNWEEFIEELQELTLDPLCSTYLNISLLKEFISKFKNGAKPEDVFELDFKMLMKSLIFYRFMKKLA